MPAPALVPVAPRPERRSIDLATMTLDDAPDLWTAIEAGIMHGLTPRHALRSAFHKWMGANPSLIQQFGLANFYACTCGGEIKDGACDRCALPHRDTSKAFVNHKAFMELAVVMLAEQEREITETRKAVAALNSEVLAIRRLLPYLPPSED